MPDTPNIRWRSHVNNLAARILEESGYKTNVDFEPVKIRELLSHGSLRTFDIEALLCGLYTESHRDRKKPSKLDIPEKVVDRRLERICARNDFFWHPERLANLTVGEFLSLKGLDEVTIPGTLEELTLALEEVRENEKAQKTKS